MHVILATSRHRRASLQRAEQAYGRVSQQHDADSGVAGSSWRRRQTRSRQGDRSRCGTAREVSTANVAELPASASLGADGRCGPDRGDSAPSFPAKSQARLRPRTPRTGFCRGPQDTDRPASTSFWPRGCRGQLSIGLSGRFPRWKPRLRSKRAGPLRRGRIPRNLVTVSRNGGITSRERTRGDAPWLVRRDETSRDGRRVGRVCIYDQKAMVSRSTSSTRGHVWANASCSGA